MNSKWFEEKEKLEDLILNQKLSYEEIGRVYNCSGSNIKKVALRIGIELPQKRKINPNETFNRPKKTFICLNCGKEYIRYYRSNSFCCHECSSEYKHKQSYKEFLLGKSEFMKPNYVPKTFKKDIIEEQNGKCAICGCEQTYNGKSLVFILDHIDGHAANNKRENLRCICPNCDSQLETYKSKNKNSDRIYYHLNYR